VTAAGLVVTSDECDADAGVSHWDVQRERQRFAAAPTAWECQLRVVSNRSIAMSEPYGSASFSLLSLGAQSRPAIVVYDDECDTEVGLSHWDAYRLE
jgi:hypothetical protein